MIVRNICSRSDEMSAHHRAKSPLTISEMCIALNAESFPNKLGGMIAVVRIDCLLKQIGHCVYSLLMT